MKLRIIYLNLCFQDETNVFVWGEYSWGVTNVWDHPYVTPEIPKQFEHVRMAAREPSKVGKKNFGNCLALFFRESHMFKRLLFVS